MKFQKGWWQAGPQAPLSSCLASGPVCCPTLGTVSLCRGFALSDSDGGRRSWPRGPAMLRGLKEQPKGPQQAGWRGHGWRRREGACQVDGPGFEVLAPYLSNVDAQVLLVVRAVAHRQAQLVSVAGLVQLHLLMQGEGRKQR